MNATTEIAAVNSLEVAEFVGRCQKIVRDYYEKHYQLLVVPTLAVEPGKRYFRIVQKQNSSCSAWAFIDSTNGDVLKAASYKAPAKHARGNLHDEHGGMKYIGVSGPAYLR